MHAPRPEDRILLVEDDAEFADLYRMALSMGGYAVDTARDGVEGLDMARRSPPALVVTDMRMPRMTGIELLRALRADPATSCLPAVVLSNYDDPAMAQEARDLGVLHWLVKVTVTPRDVLHRVPTWLAGGCTDTPSPLG
jgi:two-component system chemotaxis response regulator CheY